MRPWQAVLVLAAAAGVWALDTHYLGSDMLTFLGKQLLRITEWLAFWR